MLDKKVKFNVFHKLLSKVKKIQEKSVVLKHIYDIYIPRIVQPIYKNQALFHNSVMQVINIVIPYKNQAL